MGVSLTCFSWILTSDPRVCKSYLAFSRILTSGVSKEVFLDFLDFLDYRILTFSSVDHIYFYWILTYGPFVGSFFLPYSYVRTYSAFASYLRFSFTGLQAGGCS